MVKCIVDFLAVVGCGAFAGMLLTIGMSFGRFWKSLTPEGVLDWFSSNPRGAARPLPLVLPPTFVGLAAALWLDWNAPTARSLWIGAIAITLVNVIFTIAYFFPINGKLESKAIAPSVVSPTLHRWLAFHWIRIVLAGFASVLAFLAVYR